MKTKPSAVSMCLQGTLLRDIKLANVDEEDAHNAELHTTRRKGKASLSRLLLVAQQDTGQSSVIARFLLNLYNGRRFPFDMTDLRRLDYDLFEDCIAALRMDYLPEKEIHYYFENGSAIFEALAKEWGISDHAGATWR